MAPIKRYSSKELKEKCKDIFYNYMVNGSGLHEGDKCSEDYPTPVHLIHKEYKDALKENREKYQLYNDYIKSDSNDKSVTIMIKKEVNFLDKEYEILVRMNKEEQMKRRKETSSTSYAASSVVIPLNKRINSYYDDFVLEVLFYDDVCTLNGRFDEYCKLEENERYKFVKENTTISNMGLVIYNNSRDRILAVIAVEGEMAEPNEKNEIVLLGEKFADFNDLSLSDTMQLSNNDLRQMFQSRIDLDKEDMEMLCSKFIRGDEYKLYRSFADPFKPIPTYYIRYVCPSTGRVYYNELDLRNLEISRYFRQSDHESYLSSWWNITHLGASIEGNPVISC